MQTHDPGLPGKVVSVVVPCFNEEEVIAATVKALTDMAATRPGYRFEFIFVDDGSKDATNAKLRDLAAQDPRLCILTLSRNFGHQIAVSAGIDAARGDCVVLIDADLQDPPAIIPHMLTEWENGYDVVYGVRRVRPGETRFKRASARLFYRFLNRLSDVPIPLDTGDFRLMSRAVVDVLQDMPERHRFVRGMVAWVGFRQLALDYEREARAAGISKYPLRKMLRFASDGIVSFSIKPLRFATGLGILASGLSIAGIIYALVLRVFTANWVEGWTALIIAVLFIGGVQLVALGVIGEYVGRVYEETKKRPLYVVRDRINFDQTPLPELDRPMQEDLG